MRLWYSDILKECTGIVLLRYKSSVIRTNVVFLFSDILVNSALFRVRKKVIIVFSIQVEVINFVDFFSVQARTRCLRHCLDV